MQMAPTTRRPHRLSLARLSPDAAERRPADVRTPRPTRPAGRATIAWTTAGRDDAAAAPSAAGSNGTDRQRTTGRPASANTRSTSARAARATTRPRGRNSMTTPGRSAARAPAISDSSDPDSGIATPAPSLDSPSAANAPRWASAARPASASGSTRACDPPPASATNPTPHASCSNRWSYSGARWSRSSCRSVASISRWRLRRKWSGRRPAGTVAAWTGCRIERSGGASAGRDPGGAVPDRPFAPLWVRSGRPPRRASRGRCPSPRPSPTPGSRGSGRRP